MHAFEKPFHASADSDVLHAKCLSDELQEKRNVLDRGFHHGNFGRRGLGCLFFLLAAGKQNKREANRQNDGSKIHRAFLAKWTDFRLFIFFLGKNRSGFRSVKSGSG